MSIHVDGFKTLLKDHKIANADTVAEAKLTADEITACIASFPPIPRSFKGVPAVPKFAKRMKAELGELNAALQAANKM